MLFSLFFFLFLFFPLIQFRPTPGSTPPLPSFLYVPLPPDPLLLHFPSKKKKSITTDNNARHKSSYQDWTRQPSKKKGVPWASKRVRDTHTPTVISGTKTPSNNLNRYPEDLARHMNIPGLSVQSLWTAMSPTLLILWAVCSCLFTFTTNSSRITVKRILIVLSIFTFINIYFFILYNFVLFKQIFCSVLCQLRTI